MLVPILRLGGSAWGFMERKKKEESVRLQRKLVAIVWPAIFEMAIAV